MDKLITALNNRILIAVIVGLFVISTVRGLARR